MKNNRKLQTILGNLKKYGQPNFFKKSPKTDDEFLLIRLTFHNGLLKLLIITGILFSIYSFSQFYKYGRNPSILFFILNVFELLLVITGIILLRRKSIHVEKLTFLFSLTFFVFLWEAKFQMSRFWTKNLSFAHGIFFEALLLSMPLAKVSWKYSTLIILILNILYFSYYIDLEDIKENNYVQIPIFLVHSICVSIYSYVLEKYERKHFLEIKKFHSYQKSFENIITEILPAATMIIEKSQIIFKNEKLEEIFRKSKFNEILDETRKVKIVNGTKQPEQYKNIPPEKECPDEELIKLDKNILLQSSDGEKQISLFDIIIQSEHNFKQEKYLGVYLNSSGSFEEEKEALIFLDISVSKILWNNKEALFVFINKNDLAEKCNELNRQAKYKDKLLATVSHDLRTPLNGIIGMIKLVLDSIKDEFAQESLKIAERSSYLLLNMINDILDLSQISNGTLRLNIKLFSVMEIIEDVADLIRFQAKNKGLEFHVENKLRNKTSFMLSDPVRLKQIILNLLSNALKFTEKGFIKILVENADFKNNTECLESETDLIINEEKYPLDSYLIKVEDSGSGIKKQDIPKLFKLFGKLETEDSKRINQTGVGLGLSISQDLVKLLNRKKPDFEIKVNSQIGQGSCFYFPLRPFAAFDVKQPGIINTNEDSLIKNIPLFKNTNFTATSFKRTQIMNKNILVVEDDQVNLMVINSYLKSFENISFDVTQNGLEALTKVQTMASFKFYYNIILMDCNMPVMDGFQATKEILNFINKENLPPAIIVAMTANVSPLDYENCFRAGMKDYISKPFTRLKLLEIIKKYN